MRSFTLSSQNISALQQIWLNPSITLRTNLQHLPPDWMRLACFLQAASSRGHEGALGVTSLCSVLPIKKITGHNVKILQMSEQINYIFIIEVLLFCQRKLNVSHLNVWRFGYVFISKTHTDGKTMNEKSIQNKPVYTSSSCSWFALDLW